MPCTCWISTYPRKGTETSMGFAAFASKLIFQLIPARGRKHGFIRSNRATAFYFNLSPQGDGNRLLMSILSTNMKFQLIPARGRKPNTKDHILKIIVAFQLIPVKTLSGAARQLSRRESFSSCHLPCTKLPLSGELARRKP